MQSPKVTVDGVHTSPYACLHLTSSFHHQAYLLSENCKFYHEQILKAAAGR